MLSFTHKSRSFLQSSPFVLEIASRHDHLMHSSFSALKYQTGHAGKAECEACVLFKHISGPTEANWTFQTLLDYMLMALNHESIRTTYKYKRLQDASLSPRLPNFILLAKISLLHVLFSYCCTALKARGNYATNSLKSFVAFSDHVRPALHSQWGAKMVNILLQRN